MKNAKKWPYTEVQTKIDGVEVKGRAYATLLNRSDPDVHFAFVSCCSMSSDSEKAFASGHKKALFEKQTMVLPPEVGKWCLSLSGLSEARIEIVQGGGWSDMGQDIVIKEFCIQGFILSVECLDDGLEVHLLDKEDDISISEKIPLGDDVKTWANRAVRKLKKAKDLRLQIGALGVCIEAGEDD